MSEIYRKPCEAFESFASPPPPSTFFQMLQFFQDIDDEFAYRELTVSTWEDDGGPCIDLSPEDRFNLLRLHSPTMVRRRR